MLLIVDTREQLPLFTKGCARMALNVGDYTTADLLNKFHVERKSGADLYGTLTKGNVRFRKELIRAKDAGIELVVLVEQSRENFIAKKFPRGKERLFPSEGLRKMIATFEQKYGLQFYWCRSRSAAKAKLIRLLGASGKK